MNTSDNVVACRLAPAELREFNRLAAEQGKNKNAFAREIIRTYLVDFSKLQEINVRLSEMQRTTRLLAKQVEQLVATKTSQDGHVAIAVHELRASLATAAAQLLIDFGKADNAHAIEWTKQVFNVREES